MDSPARRPAVTFGGIDRQRPVVPQDLTLPGREAVEHGLALLVQASAEGFRVVKLVGAGDEPSRGRCLGQAVDLLGRARQDGSSVVVAASLSMQETTIAAASGPNRASSAHAKSLSPWSSSASCNKAASTCASRPSCSATSAATAIRWPM